MIVLALVERCRVSPACRAATRSRTKVSASPLFRVLQECVSLFQEFLDDVKLLGSEQATEMVTSSLDYAKAHLAVIQQWGRFPHRNVALGRANTPEEDMQIKSIPRF